MAIHDWTRVDAGTWHAFHLHWLSALARDLNNGRLPDGYYADPERLEPDVLTLEEASHEIMDDEDDDGGAWDEHADGGGGTAVATAPARTVAAAPGLSLRRSAPAAAEYAAKTRHIAVRHASGDRLVALLELASPGNKDRPAAVESFARKAADALRSGVHVSLIDLFPPRRHEPPAGLCGAVADAAGFEPFDWPADKPLGVAAFEAARPPNLYAEPLAVADELPDLPLFYKRGRHVDVPLAATYAAAWEATPRRWRKVIEG